MTTRVAVIVALLALLACPSFAFAQRSIFDPDVHPPPSVQRSAVWVSNAAVISALGLEIFDAARASRPQRTLVLTGARVGLTAGVTLGVKHLFHRLRPCAPVCGAEDAYASMPSGHTALAFTSTGTRRGLTYTLSGLTAGGRVVGRKHWLTDTLVGAGVGWAARWIR